MNDGRRMRLLRAMMGEWVVGEVIRVGRWARDEWTGLWTDVLAFCCYRRGVALRAIGDV